jgi:tRNA-splicing ligase RtcB
LPEDHAAEFTKPPMKKISEVCWEVDPSFKPGMRVPALVYATKKLLDEMDVGVFEQITNVACLPGIQKHAICMPDGHWGYGFPIGGVAAFDTKTGVISPGGIGFDINCGMRLLRTNLTVDDIRPKLKELVDTLFKTVPTGVGARGAIKLTRAQLREIMLNGSKWAIENGYGWSEDLERTEEYGMIKGADPGKISDKAQSRGIEQLGTLGSGNHYLEIQYVEHIFDEELAKKWGIHQTGQICVMFHCGSRGFGHQVATDYLNTFGDAMKRHGITVRDRELACAPFSSKEGQDYFHAMACAANAAFANRQAIAATMRKSFEKVFGRSAEDMDMAQIYDVAHNIAKVEQHEIDGHFKDVVMHRKGATRCFGPHRPELPQIYQSTGQPVIIGGSMETGSFLLVGTEKAMNETFGSTMHGSGRTMSRTKAKHIVRGSELQQQMQKRGIYVKSVSMSGLAEEAGLAYKDLNEVVETMEIAGVSHKVCSLKPLGNIKG